MIFGILGKFWIDTGKILFLKIFFRDRTTKIEKISKFQKFRNFENLEHVRKIENQWIFIEIETQWIFIENLKFEIFKLFFEKVFGFFFDLENIFWNFFRTYVEANLSQDSENHA